jgi:5-oxopent-3-ene-1,2,5-tricarboxylate decarboxylase/2-hydroxyhepta-2,4-diene-1,7-dioate isomerase
MNATRSLADGTLLQEGDFRWLPPADGTLFALGLNYADHASELEFKPPTEPLVFIKAPNTFIGHQQSRYARITSNTCTTKPNWWW